MNSFFVFDVESVGLYGEGFAVGGGVYLANGAAQWEFKFCCPIDECAGTPEDRKWVKTNVPEIVITNRLPITLRGAFWHEWLKAKHSGALMAADCSYPVESIFLVACIRDLPQRQEEAPYPLVDIASYMMAAGFDPLANYEREPSELPIHDPLADARQSARLLAKSITKLHGPLLTSLTRI